MATMNISVSNAMRDWVQAQIEGGRYTSPDEYVRDLIRRDQDMDKGDERWRAYIDRGIELGIADKQAGRVISAEVVFDRLRAKCADMSNR